MVYKANVQNNDFAKLRKSINYISLIKKKHFLNLKLHVLATIQSVLYKEPDLKI